MSDATPPHQHRDRGTPMSKATALSDFTLNEVNGASSYEERAKRTWGGLVGIGKVVWHRAWQQRPAWRCVSYSNSKAAAARSSPQRSGSTFGSGNSIPQPAASHPPPAAAPAVYGVFAELFQAAYGSDRRAVFQAAGDLQAVLPVIVADVAHKGRGGHLQLCVHGGFRFTARSQPASQLPTRLQPAVPVVRCVSAWGRHLLSKLCSLAHGTYCAMLRHAAPPCSHCCAGCDPLRRRWHTCYPVRTA